MAQDEEKNKYFYFATGPVKPGVSDTMSGIVRGDVNLLNGRLEGVLCVMVNFGENFAPVSDHVSIFPTFWMEIKTLESFNKMKEKFINIYPGESNNKIFEKLSEEFLKNIEERNENI